MDMVLLKRMKEKRWLMGSEMEKLVGDLRQANGVGVDDGTVDVFERHTLCQRPSHYSLPGVIGKMLCI